MVRDRRLTLAFLVAMSLLSLAPTPAEAQNTTTWF